MVFCPSCPANCFGIIDHDIVPGGWLPCFSPYTIPHTGHSIYKLVFCWFRLVAWPLRLMIKWFRQFKCIKCSHRISDTAGLVGLCCNSSRHIEHGLQLGHLGGWTTVTKRLIISLSASTPTMEPATLDAGGRNTSSSPYDAMLDGPLNCISLLSWLRYVEMVSMLGLRLPTDDTVVLQQLLPPSVSK